MCGFAGIYEKGVNNNGLMQEMLDIIEHRGPDSSSVYSHEDFTLGHRRLSIIDLETGDQPIFNEDKSICIVFNGEIYNFLELKDELLESGHKFYTKSDTEVIVHGYEQWGYEIFEKLNGIFSFALFDKKENKLLLVRDHFGVKPLHYYYKDGILIFGSEQKSILLHKKVDRKINLHSLHSHLNLRYTQRDETLFDGVKRLPPAHFVEFKNNHLEIKKYWQLNPQVDLKMSETDAIEKMDHLLHQAVKRQLISDVPLGVYLSGGMDSSTIVQKMSEIGVAKIKSFTMGFNEPTDEFTDAELIAKEFGTEHHTLNLALDPLKMLPQVIWHSEEPKINLLQGFNMSKFVKKDITVVLGGLGGDELFAGYDIHKFIYPFNKYHSKVPNAVKKILSFKSDILFKMQNASGTMSLDEYRRGVQMLLSVGNIEKFYSIVRNIWDNDKGFYNNVYNSELTNKIKSEIDPAGLDFEKYFNQVKNLSELDQVLYTEFHTKMVNDYLLVEDRMSMANSVEERVPFLDRDLVEFGFSIPVHLKIKNNQTKYLFRKAMEPKLPKRIVKKKKWGFTVNPYLQFKKDLKTVAEKILTKEFIAEQGIFNYDYLQKIINHSPKPSMRWHYNYLWIVLGLAIWEKMYIRSDDFKKKEFDIEKYYN